MTTSTTPAEDRVRALIEELLSPDHTPPVDPKAVYRTRPVALYERAAEALQALTLERDAMREGLSKIRDGQVKTNGDGTTEVHDWADASGIAAETLRKASRGEDQAPCPMRPEGQGDLEGAAADLLDAVTPFRAIWKLNEPLHLADELPVAGVIPGGWPLLGELRLLYEASERLRLALPHRSTGEG